MPITINIATACSICECRMDENDFELGRVGSHGPICARCVSCALTECEGCDREGARGVFSDGAHFHFFPWRVLIREAWESEMLRTVRIAHPDWPHTESMFAARMQADQFAGRVAANIALSSPSTWGIDIAQMVPILRTAHGDWLCEMCCETCMGCGDIYHSGEIADELCDTCRMPECPTCGHRWEFQSEADTCCGSGMEGVHDWDYRPEFRFWMTNANGDAYWANGRADGWHPIQPPSDALFMGIELETERGADAFPDFLSNAGEDEHAPLFVYGKRDGSLSDESGVELVTMPATLDAFRKRFPWQALAQWNDDGARSFYMGTCGFHVHVSRSHFTPTHLWRFVAWQMRNQWFCERIAQRNNSQWARWQTLGEFRDHGKTLSDVVKGKADNGERYVAINFQNATTVELRYFRGNLRADAILTRLEFVDALAAFTRDITASDVVAGALSVPNFAEFVNANTHRYPTLAAWIVDNETEWEDN